MYVTSVCFSLTSCFVQLPKSVYCESVSMAQYDYTAFIKTNLSRTGVTRVKQVHPPSSSQEAIPISQKIPRQRSKALGSAWDEVWRESNESSRESPRQRHLSTSSRYIACRPGRSWMQLRLGRPQADGQIYDKHGHANCCHLRHKNTIHLQKLRRKHRNPACCDALSYCSMDFMLGPQGWWSIELQLLGAGLYKKISAKPFSYNSNGTWVAPTFNLPGAVYPKT